MNCPNCNKPIPDKLILSESGKIRGSKTSKRKAKASRENGKKNVSKLKKEIEE